jgi:hypothetical protein
MRACFLLLASFLLLVLGGCPLLTGDDDGATLDWTPTAAARGDWANGAEALVEIRDECTGDIPLSGCSFEAVTEIRDVAFDESVLEAAATGETAGELSVRAVGTGETQLYVAAHFDDDVEGVRSAESRKSVHEIAGVYFEPACSEDEATSPWLLPAGAAFLADLGYRAAGGARLFHHEADYAALLTFPDGAPTTLDAGDHSPTVATLTLPAADVAVVEDAEGVNLADLDFYGAGEVDDVELDGPGDAEVEDLIEIEVVALVGNRPVCRSHPDALIEARVEDGQVCGFDGGAGGSISRDITGAQPLEVYAYGPGTCRVTVDVGPASASIDIDIQPPPEDED